jgi:pyruvate kinase
MKGFDMSHAELPHHTKIVATYGPAVGTTARLYELLQAGVDVLRYNFSHGTGPDFGRLVRRVRRLESDLGRPVGILADLQGPKIRTGELAGHAAFDLPDGAPFFLTPRPIIGTPEGISISYSFNPEEIHSGDRILLDDGKITLRAIRSEDDRVICMAERGGQIREHQGVFLPGTATSLPSMTDKDLRDAAAAVEGGADFIALSFVRRADDMEELRALTRKAPHPPWLVAKIEKPQALENLPQIVAVSDAVMVARGDLGVEVDIHRIGILQKEIIHLCRRWRTPVIVATQMLDSMIERPGPTRAEATDITNAILDGADAVMLSGETATGRYPFDAVHTMRLIANETEAYIGRTGGRLPLDDGAALPAGDPLLSIVHAGITAARDMAARAIIVHTLSGRTARVMSRYHAACPIVAFTPSPSVRRQMTLLYGVCPQRIALYKSSDQLVRQAETRVRRLFPIDEPLPFVILSGRAFTEGATNTLRIRTLQPDKTRTPESTPTPEAAP